MRAALPYIVALILIGLAFWLALVDPLHSLN
jgi:hypothetical protein